MTEKTIHPASAAVLAFFEYEHLGPALSPISREFHRLAHDMALKLDGPEVTVGLRKLLEAKDCMVRAAVADLGQEG